MISPEMLRRYPFFGEWDDAFLKSFAMLGNEVHRSPGQTIYESGAQAEKFYLLVEGCVESYLMISDPGTPGITKEFYLVDINPGEVFGLSSLVEPYLHTTTMRASTAVRLLEFDAPALRELAQTSGEAGRVLALQIARAAIERLQSTRTQLAAARFY